MSNPCKEPNLIECVGNFFLTHLVDFDTLQCIHFVVGFANYLERQSMGCNVSEWSRYTARLLKDVMKEGKTRDSYLVNAREGSFPDGLENSKILERHGQKIGQYQHPYEWYYVKSPPPPAVFSILTNRVARCSCLLAVYQINKRL